MRISDWSSDVCSSDLGGNAGTDFCLGCVDDSPLGMSLGRLAVASRIVGQRLKDRKGCGPAIPCRKDRCVVVGKRGGASGRRTEERRVGEEWVSTCGSRWSQSH